jgi:hypothetical protein
VRYLPVINIGCDRPVPSFRNPVSDSNIIAACGTFTLWNFTIWWNLLWNFVAVLGAVSVSEGLTGSVTGLTDTTATVSRDSVAVTRY